MIEGEYASRTLSDGRYAFVYPITFGRARLGVARAPGEMSLDNVW